jgi:GDP-L-fucose synthase
MEKNAKIYVAGHGGLVGSALGRNLKKKGFNNIIGRRSSELDLTRQAEVEAFFGEEKPDYVFLAAAKVGGISVNSRQPAEFMYQNLTIETNVINAAYQHHVKRLLFMGSGCIYPRIVPQPIKPEYLLTSELEKTNEAYALAKIAGLKMCEFYNQEYGTNYLSVMPCNLYGTGDNFNLQNSHVVPALIRKFHEAKITGAPTATIWGTGSAMREFMHVDDMADATVFLMENFNDGGWLNVGVGSDLSIRELAEMIRSIVGFDGQIVYDTSMPDGTPRKLLDSSVLFSLGWKPGISLEEGLVAVYKDYVKNSSNYRK